MTGQTIYIEMSELDYKLILRVKQLREEHGFSQVELSHKMGLSSGFIGSRIVNST